MQKFFDPRITLGNLISIVAFVAGAAIWYATVGASIQQIETEQAAMKLSIRDIDQRLTENERDFAVSENQAKWILESLQRLQADRGIYTTPPNNNHHAPR